MECRICGKNYKVLACHVWQAHKISVPEYKISYDYPLTKALADDCWILRMKEIGNEMKKTDLGGRRLSDLIIAGQKQNDLRASGKINNPVRKRKYWPKTSMDNANKMPGASRKKNVEVLYDTVKYEWSANIPIKQMCVSDMIIYRWIREGRLAKRKKKATDSQIKILGKNWHKNTVK
jgi:hypothetical protein